MSLMRPDDGEFEEESRPLRLKTAAFPFYVNANMSIRKPEGDLGIIQCVCTLLAM